MALSVDYSTVTPWLITIPKSDLTLITGTQYQLTVDEFWILLRDFTDNETPVARPKLYSRIPATSSTPSITTIDDDYSLEFEDGLYSVNIVNGNTNIREVEVKNQVSVNTNNTTGFIDPQYLQSSTFAGGLGISVAAITGTDSSIYPVGIEETPCKTEANIEAIYAERGYRRVRVQESMTLLQDHSAEKHIWVGDNPQDVTLILDNACDVTSNKFEALTITGKLDDDNELRECIVQSITNANGFIYNSTIIGPITASGDLSIQGCWVTPGAVNSEFTLDFNSQAVSCEITGFQGGRVLIKNMVTGSTFFMAGAGKVTFDNTNIGGDVSVFGNVEISNSGTFDDFDDDTIFTRTNDTWQFDGNDINNVVSISGDGETSSTAVVDGKTKTVLPSSITRS